MTLVTPSGESDNSMRATLGRDRRSMLTFVVQCVIV